MRPPDPLDLVEAYLVVTTVDTGATLVDLAPAGESIKLTARSLAVLLRSLADDLESEQPRATRPKPAARR